MSEVAIGKRFEGQLLEGRYRLTKLLSEGNFGGVFHARLELFGEPIRDVAVKITKETNLSKETAREIFGEAMTLIRVYDQITDPVAKSHIVPVYDLGLLDDHDGRGFIVMGLIRGIGSTAERIQPPDTLGAEIARYGSGMPVDVAVQFFRQICTGLAAVHKLQVIHRDLKPDNILITDDGRIRIVDFGLAVGLNGAGFASGVAGTHRYMAPETALYGQSDPSSDVYSIGICLYQMLTGVYPFEHLVPPPALLHQQREEWIVAEKRRTPIKPPREIQRTIPGWLNDLTLDCLRFRVSDGRPASAQTLLDRLESGSKKAKSLSGSKAGSKSNSESPVEEVDALLALGWQTWRNGNGDWAGAATRLEAAAAEIDSRHDPRWFEIMCRLALCYIQTESAAKVYEVLGQLEKLIAQGVFLDSYRQRADFFDGFAQMLHGKRGMAHWESMYRQKAKSAREKAQAARRASP